MRLHPFTAITLALTLAACSSSENALPPADTPAANTPLTASITPGPAPGPTLEPLPDVTFTPDTDEFSGRPIDGALTPDSEADAAGTAPGAGPSSSDGGASVSRPETISIEPGEPQPEFQAGSLTAADYDDQLNPHLYQRYASDYLQTYGGKLDMPYLDLSNRIVLHVTDQQGWPYGGVKISIADANTEIINITTPASGITYL